MVEIRIIKWKISTCRLLTKNLLGFDGEAIEFEWNIFPGFSSWQILQEFRNDLRRRNIELEKFTDRIIFMSMFHRNTTPPRQRADIKDVIAKLREMKIGAVAAEQAFFHSYGRSPNSTA